MHQGTSIFTGREGLLVSMHGKEVALSPSLQAAFDIRLRCDRQIDTDAFGTFSGTVARRGSQREAAWQKIEAGKLAARPGELILASEGAFNPHPDSPFITLNTELVVLYDPVNDLAVEGSFVTMNCRAASRTITQDADLLQFARAVEFPVYGIMLKANGREGLLTVFKDADTEEALLKQFTELINAGDRQAITAETDLRAHRNPLRMEAIRQAAENLVQHMQSQCPVCNRPGFAAVETLRGLLCALCGLPTRLPRAQRLQCAGCNHKELRPLADQPAQADPQYCDYCNP